MKGQAPPHDQDHFANSDKDSSIMHGLFATWNKCNIGAELL